MRLSTAIILGSVTCELRPFDINSCAYGCALNAMGAPTKEHCNRYALIEVYWPWIRSSGAVQDLAVDIMDLFDLRVCDNLMTLEQLADYVRSIEPDCDCNRFNCSCAKPQQETVQECLQAQ